MKYRGSCHCGQVAYEVEGEISGVISCNCSMCQRKGSLLWFVPRESLTLLTPENASSVYKFNKHVIAHHFCPSCGIHPYGEGRDPQGRAIAAINIRTLEDVDLAEIAVTPFDGRSK
ncbi:GFA family protein [Ramlibacter solisilvae]|uniref:Aldehyde-activating protein n=1 Tax=Ramlibacter tataouinensis TaxID=94132 RepID=A0A127JPB1_9BURK|nr:GFA family protein [Ramlibacter tataouinensis]AMO21874.1 aldehyde-activating protein [Ramlibacter tataouinensis]